MAKLIILNGPPGCGKDTIASELLRQNYVDAVVSLKEPMFEILKSMMTAKEFNEFQVRYDNRETKEARWPVIGMSPRQMMIHISENVVKPVFGKEQFGKIMSDKLPDGDLPIVCSDGGFPDEIRAMARSGRHQIHIVRLYRNGYTFDGDSRNYISLDCEFDNVTEVDVALSDGGIDAGVNDVAALCLLWRDASLR